LQRNDVSVSAWFADADAIVWEYMLAAIALGAPSQIRRIGRLRARAQSVSCLASCGMKDDASAMLAGRHLLKSSGLEDLHKEEDRSPSSSSSSSPSKGSHSPRSIAPGLEAQLVAPVIAKAVECLDALGSIPAEFAVAAANKTQEWIESQTG